MGQFFDSIKNVKNNYYKYDQWEQAQADERARKEYLAKTLELPEDQVELTSKKAETVIRATEIMDRYSEDNCEDMEQATGIAAAVTIMAGSLAGQAATNHIHKSVTDKITNKINAVKQKLSDHSLPKEIKEAQLNELKFLNQRLSKAGKQIPIYGLVANTVITLGLAAGMILWGNSQQKKASRIGRYQAKQNDLKDITNFVIYTPEQIAQAEEIAKKIPDKKERSGLIKIIKELQAIGRDEKAYKQWLVSKDDKEIEKLKSLNLTPEQLKTANEDKELIVDAVKEINIKAEEYSENIENAFDTLGMLSWLIAIPAGFVINSVMKLLKLPQKIRTPISFLVPLLTSISLSTSGTVVQKEASKVGRYVARKDLLNNPARLMAYSDEDMQKAEKVKAPEQKKTVFEKIANSFVFLNTYQKDKKEYNNYKKNIAQKQEKLQKAFEQIPISNEQRKDAEKLQKKVFLAFDEIDEMSQRYSEDVEAGCEIAKNVMGNLWGLGIGGASIWIAIAAAKGKFPISKLANTITNIGLKKDSTLRNAVNNLYNTLKKDKKLMHEFHLALTSNNLKYFLKKPKSKEILTAYNKLKREVKNLSKNGNGLSESIQNRKVFEELLKPHLKTGKIATWVRNLITESSQLWAATKLNKVMPDLVKQTGLNNWKNYKTLIGTGLVAGVPILGIIFSIPYAFNAWLTNIQKKAGKIGIMQAMNKIDDPRVFADPPTDNEPKHIKTSSKTVQETILPVKNTNLLAQINQHGK